MLSRHQGVQDFAVPPLLVGVKCSEIMIELPIRPCPAKSLRVSSYVRQISRTAFCRSAFKNPKFTEINWTFFPFRPEIDFAKIGNHFRFVIRIAPIQRPYLGE